MRLMTKGNLLNYHLLWPLALLLCGCNSSGSVEANSDNYTITISRPSADFESVSGTTSLSAEVNIQTAIARVDFYINDQLVGSDTNTPFSYQWDTLGYADGSYRLTTYQIDNSGHSTSSEPRILNVSNQVTAAINCTPSTTDTALLNAHNIARASARYCGDEYHEASNPLRWNCELRQSASLHSQDMATHNFFNHEGSDESRIGQRARAAGYDYQIVGENIAAGQTSITQVMNEWLDSPGHCRNIMESRYQELGAIKLASPNPDSGYPVYWTANFGTQQGM